MTELETHLLNALRKLQSEFAEQHRESQNALEALRSMFETTSSQNRTLLGENQRLATQVTDLSRQLSNLNEDVNTLMNALKK
jgi:archaellum component FlaC